MSTKTCLITGTASGMGRLTAIAAAREGMRVICVDIDTENGLAVQAEIAATTGNDNVEFIACDVSSQAQVRELAARVNRDYDRLDILVNNAGITESVRRESAEAFEITMATNFLGPFLLTNLLLDKMRASTPARIINICSDAHRMSKTLDWDDTIIVSSKETKTTDARRKEASWKLQGQMEQLHGKVWFRKLAKMGYWQTRQCPNFKKLKQFLNEEITELDDIPPNQRGFRDKQSTFDNLIDLFAVMKNSINLHKTYRA